MWWLFYDMFVALVAGYKTVYLCHLDYYTVIQWLCVIVYQVAAHVGWGSCLLFACFECYLKIINTLWKNKINILKQIVWETQKWHENFSTPSGSWVIDQNMQNSVLLNNSWTTWPKKILMPSLSFSDNMLYMLILFFKKCWWFWDHAPNAISFWVTVPP